MKVKVLSKTEDSLQLDIKDTNSIFANALRRTIISSVPNVAIESVDIMKNSSALYNEVLAHRLGLIPLKFKNDGARGDINVVMVLDKKGPCTVYAGDFKSTDAEIKPVDPNIIIVKLLPNQEVKLEAKVKISSGTDHAKWIPAKVGYRYSSTFKLSKDCDGCGICVDECPKGIIEKKYNKANLIGNSTCDLCNICVEVCPKHAIELTGDETRIMFNVKSVSGQKVEDIMSSALNLLKDELKELENALEQKEGTETEDKVKKVSTKKKIKKK